LGPLHCAISSRASFAVTDTRHRKLRPGSVRGLGRARRRSRAAARYHKRVFVQHPPKVSVAHRRSYNNETTKGAREEPVPIAAALVPYLEYALEAFPGPFLFPRADGSMRTEQDALAKRLQRAVGRAGLVDGYLHHCRRCKRAGTPHEEKHADCKRRQCPRCGMTLWTSALPRKFRLHDTRHTTATLLLAAGVDLYAVARILRHTDPRLTFKTYAHLVHGYLHAQIDRLPSAQPAKFAALVLHEGGKGEDRTDSDVKNLKAIQRIGVEPTAGLEPATCGLRNRCSTD